MNTPKATHGGARPGAGRKKNEPVLLDLGFSTDDPKEFLLAIMVNVGIDVKLRVDAAKSLMPFIYTKLNDRLSGKKDMRQAAASNVVKGKYSPSAPPKLSVIKLVRDR